MSRKYIQIFLHVLACFAFLAFAIFLAPGPEINAQTITNPHTIRDIISYFLIFLFFYLNFYFLLPKYYFQKKHFKYIFSLLFSFAAIIIIPRLIFFSERDHIESHGRFPGPPPGFGSAGDYIQGNGMGPGDSAHFDGKVRDHHDHHPGRPHRTIRHSDFYGFDLRHLAFEATQIFIMFILVILFSLLIKTRNKLRSAEKEKLNAELSYLKAQINPHFLFNTLNSIYSLAIEKSDYTPTAIVKLSGMMRYVLTESSADFVSLEKEINYIRDFVDLQKLRVGNTAEVNFEITGDFMGNRIAPLILIAFIENAFKHGVNPEQKSAIEIHLKIAAKKLHLIVKNNKVNLNTDLSNQVGLENTINRLDLIYPSKYTLHFRENDNEYKVELILELI
jgi:hypothetical protein